MVSFLDEVWLMQALDVVGMVVVLNSHRLPRM
jgi:hypothetical protein